MNKDNMVSFGAAVSIAMKKWGVGREVAEDRLTEAIESGQLNAFVERMDGELEPINPPAS